MRAGHVVAALLLILHAERGWAQCADGSPPPCPQPVARAQMPQLDPQRVAVLPFRVTTADSLLGEGLAELVATEFTGESAPRAMHMGSVLRAWRRAGGGLRTPLSQDEGLRVARELGAGHVIEGSVVGLGPRLRINASIVDVRSRRARAIEPVSGSPDSLETLLRRLSAALIAVAGGAPTQASAPLSDSPAAMRAYLTGISEWRRQLYDQALASFEQAWRADTLFAAAAFMRFRVGNWILEPNNATWTPRVAALRHRLSREDKLLHSAYVGEQGGILTQAARLENRRRVAALLPESPDAQFLLGDWLFHWGFMLQERDWLAQANEQFDRAIALDSLGSILRHSLEIALVTDDTARIRRLPEAVARTSSDPFVWSYLWIAAGRVHDATVLAQLRRDAAERRRPLSPWRAANFGLSTALTDEMHALVRRHGTPAEVRSANAGSWVANIIKGRPAAAASVPMQFSDTVGRDVLFVLAALYAHGDMSAGAAAAKRLMSTTPADTLRHAEVACALAQWRARHREDVSRDLELLPRLGHDYCAAAVALAVAPPGTAADAALASADTVIRLTQTRYSILNYGGTERYILAREWERRGDPARALGAIRAKSTFQGIEWTLGDDLREEGRLAAAVGDTSAAVAAYKRYLQVRGDPEPVLLPQRDSVRAELRRLQKP